MEKTAVSTGGRESLPILFEHERANFQRVRQFSDAVLPDDLGPDQFALLVATQAFDTNDGITNLAQRG
ncbi:hypothetical protein DEM27_22000 [Metarhizobium album]|uniref:Uncharacterized protein n=1 Tax=Metarhizobium album TaxID=2182425 RepID=A0A2U2DL30_9HYPH|nr:hypothetical protein DEM27_22000 [Rhizobium album]